MYTSLPVFLFFQFLNYSEYVEMGKRPLSCLDVVWGYIPLVLNMLLVLNMCIDRSALVGVGCMMLVLSRLVCTRWVWDQYKPSFLRFPVSFIFLAPVLGVIDLRS